MGPVSNKPLEEKELFSVKRSLASVCYSLKLKNLKKYDIHQQGIKNVRHLHLHLICQATLMFTTLVYLSPVSLLPQNLQSLLPLEPIEDPNSWAWANHPREGFSYKSKDGLSVEVCLQNPKLIATAKCQLPLDVCLSNPQYIAQVGCSGMAHTMRLNPI